MIRFSVCVLIFLVGAAFNGQQAGESLTKSKTQNEDDLALLKEQRLDWLQKRVTEIGERIKVDSLSNKDMIEPQIDLLFAKITYSESKAEREVLHDKLAEVYDTWIEILKLESTNGGPPAMEIEGRRRQAMALPELYRVQAKKLEMLIQVKEMIGQME